MKDVAIYGAGGFGREIACLINRINNETGHKWNLIGFFDDGIPVGESNEYGRILGNIDDLNVWDKPLAVVFAIGSPQIVQRLFKRVSNPRLEFPNIIAPDTLFLDYDNVKMGKGNIICSRCLVSCNVSIGDFNTFNGYITLGHDSVIGDFNTVMPAVKISGGVAIGNCNLLGVNSVILQYKSIADDVIIGTSSVVIRNIKSAGTYIGNPAKKLQF